MEYILKSSVIIFLFIGFYKLVLKNETYFNSIRYYFVSGLILSLILPLITIPKYVAINSNDAVNILAINHVDITTYGATEAISAFDVTTLLYYIYVIGVLFLIIKFLVQVTSLFVLILKYKLPKKGDYYIINVDEDIAPFSFFNLIVYNSNQFKKEELDQIIIHELIHAKQLHSIDTLGVQLLAILQWFNPFIWIYKRELQQNLEFLADNSTQEKVHCKKSYQRLLLKTTTSNHQLAITNNFYNSQLKKRILMLHKKRSTNKNQWKFALISPLLIAFLVLFNTEIIAQNSEDKDKIVELKSNILELVISEKASQQSLDKVVKEFTKNGLKLKFSGIKRNNDKEIIAIKIDAKATNGKAAASYAADNDKTIKPITISYDKENNSLSIGSNHGSKHEYHFSNNGKAKIIKRMGKKGHTEEVLIEMHDDEDHDSHTNIWVSDNGKYKKISTKKEVIVEIDDDGNEIKKEIIKIRRSKGSNDNDFIFINENDDPNTKTTYIVNGKKMSKEEFERMDKKNIRTIEIKKEVKKKNKK